MPTNRFLVSVHLVEAEPTVYVRVHEPRRYEEVPGVYVLRPGLFRGLWGANGGDTPLSYLEYRRR